MHELSIDITVTILADSRVGKYFQKMDIVVSITDEAIYESQWLQFNFDSVRNFIHPEAILIPRQSSMSIAPITSAKAHAYLLDGYAGYHRRNPAQRLQNYYTRAQIISPIYTRNVYECATRQELFSFTHSHTCDEKFIEISAETRLKRLEFKIDCDCIVTGFGGYNQINLYKDVTLNNQAITNSQNENCVPMAYFPLKVPQTLNSEDKFNVAFWMQNNVERRRFWYEWATIAPQISINHNLKGQAYTLQLLNSV